MKKILLAILLLNLFSCFNISEKSNILSFQNVWGVAFYIYPRTGGDCNYRSFFLPFKKNVDTALITDSASIFDFDYKPGIGFYSDKPIFWDQIQSANPKKYVFEKGNDHHIIYWEFMKLKFHRKPFDVKLDFDNLITDTLIRKMKQLQIHYYQLQRNIEIDTAFGKKKYINPWNNPEFRKKINKYVTPPC